MTRAELLQKLRELKPWLAEQGIVNVRLFGSYARDEAGPDSDVDLLVDLSRPMGLRFYSLAEDLSDMLGRRVELLADDGLRNPFVRAEALRDSLAI
ncbi:nucleotidyltransferase family protein [uncultured Brevundimonas sp.]|uniref:nucleotidyltransferase family protein n=1 Tax=uncultured Brevundimonas sp. TaxID=213418 RepID=UPI000FAC1D30|nr:nucleotidyltransferase family protein [uncultured Brevundimonas sp.]